MSPAPRPPRIGRTLRDSEPTWPKPQQAPEGTPNVVFIVFDDVGYSDFGCYGSEIQTPHLDTLAAGGLRYTGFHTTGLCSATRACLMTGRNHHRVGMATLTDWDLGFPGSRGRLVAEAATVAEWLRPAGWNTGAIGKWHLTPMRETTPAGPFDQWPLQRGLRPLLRFLRRRDQPLVSRTHARQPPLRRRSPARLPPERRPRRPGDRPLPRPESPGSRQAAVSEPRLRRGTRPPPGAARIHGALPRGLREGLRPDPRRPPGAPDRTRHRAPRHPPHSAPRRGETLGRSVAAAPANLLATPGGLRGDARARRRPGGPLPVFSRVHRPTREHAHLRDLGQQGPARKAPPSAP